MNRDEIALLLPAVFQSTRSPDPDAQPDLLSALLAVMERLHAPEPDLLDELGIYSQSSPPRYLGWDGLFDRLEIFFDPEQTATRFLPYLTGWLALDNLLLALLAETHPDWASIQLRSRPLRWHEMLTWLRDPQTCPLDIPRLRQLLVAAPELVRLRGTGRGLERYLEVATGLTGRFHIRNTSRPFHIRVQAPPLTHLQAVLVRNIIELEKPAHVTYEPKFAAGDKP